MGRVSDVIVLGMIDDGYRPEDATPRTNVDRLSDYLREHHSGDELAEISDHAGGSQAFQAHLWAAAIKNLDIEQFVEAFRAIPWEYPALLLIKDEHDDEFTVYRVAR